MKFSVIHPTARVTKEFESPWWIAASSACAGCDHPEHVEYLLVVHESRMFEFWRGFRPPTANGRWWASFRVIVNRGRDCIVDQGNAALEAAQGEIIVGHQDDMRFPEHWDTEVLKLIPDTSQLVCVQARTDGGRKDLLTIPTICTMAMIRATGITPPEYESMFCDDEFSYKAWKLGKIVRSSLYFEHLHFTVGKAKIDSVYSLENRPEAYQVGWEVFQRRKAAGFPRVPFPGEAPETWKDGGLVAKATDWFRSQFGSEDGPKDPPILAVCVPGNHVSITWLEAFLNIGVRLGEHGYAVKRFLGYTSNVYHSRAQLTERCIEDAKITGQVPKYVLWLDSDNLLLPDQLTGLLKFMDHYSEVDAIAGWCWIRKAHGWTTSVGNFWPEDGVHLMAMNADALFEGATPEEKFAPKRIEHTGFPCVLVRYEAFEKLGAGAFRPLTKADLPEYFGGNRPAVEVSKDWYSGEDTSWCLFAKKAGMTLVVDPGCKVGHEKLQLQEPDIKITEDTPQVLKDLRAGINGRPVDVPPEYERVGIMT